MERYIKVKDEKLKALVIKKGEIVVRGRKHYEKMQELHEEGNTIGADRNEIVSEIIKLTGEAIKDEKMGEFELASTTDIVDGELVVLVVDKIAQFKENLREQKAKAERKEAGEMTPEESMEDNKNKVIEAISSIEPSEVDSKLKEILNILK